MSQHETERCAYRVVSVSPFHLSSIAVQPQQDFCRILRTPEQVAKTRLPASKCDKLITVATPFGSLRAPQPPTLPSSERSRVASCCTTRNSLSKTCCLCECRSVYNRVVTRMTPIAGPRSKIPPTVRHSAKSKPFRRKNRRRHSTFFDRGAAVAV